MTVQEMHLSFKILLDKLDSEQYPDILPEEIDYFLNLSQERFVKQRYGIANNKREAFEETEKRMDDIREVIFDYNLQLSSSDFNKFNVYGNTYQIPFSNLNRYWFTLRQMITLVDKKCSCDPCQQVLPITQIQTDDYTRIIQDPFNKPSIKYPISLFKEYIELDFGGVIDFTKYDVVYSNRYLHKPFPVNFLSIPKQSCKLADHTHQEIVDQAVSIALETIESQRFQSQINVLNNQE